MTILIIGCSLLFLLLAISKLEYAFYAFIGMLPFTPAYIAIPLGGGGGGVSLQQIFMCILFLMVLFSIFLKKNFLNEIKLRIRRWKFLCILLILFFVVRAISTLMLNEMIGIISLLYETFGVAIIFLLSVKYFHTIQDVRKIFVVVTVSLLFCEFLVLVEFILQHPLLQNVVDLEVSSVGLEVLTGSMRDDVYRAQGLFDHSLSLAEFICYGAIFTFGAYYSGAMKQAALLAMILAIPAIYATGARSGMLVLLTALFFFIYFHAGQQSNGLRILMKWFGVMFIVMLLTLFVFSIGSPDEFMSISSSFFGSGSLSGDASTLFRLMQYSVIFDTLLDNNSLFGFGVRNHVRDDLGMPLDSYFLRMLIEAGFIGLIAYIFVVLYVVRAVFFRTTCYYNEEIYIFYMAFLLCFIEFKFFLSMPTNNFYLYLVFGMLVSMDLLRSNSLNTRKSVSKHNQDAGIK